MWLIYSSLGLLTISGFGSWAGAAVFNLLAIFVFGLWVGERIPEEGTGLAAGDLGVWHITHRENRNRECVFGEGRVQRPQ